MRLAFILILIITLVSNAIQGQDGCSDINLEQGLIAHFPLNNSAIEALGSGFDGSVIGAVPVIDRYSNPNSAYSFDGNDDEINVGDHFDLGESDFTISCWVNVFQFKGMIPGTGSRGGWIVNKGGTIFGTPRRAGFGLNALELNDEHYFNFFVGDQNDNIYSVSELGFDENNWYNVMGVKSNDSISLYVDNTLMATRPIPANINVNTNIPLVFGSIDKLGNDPIGTTYFEGIIDDVRIYNRVLNTNERNCLINECTLPPVDLGEDQVSCQESVILDATGPNLTYLWSNGSTNPTININESGLYWVTVTNSCGSATDSVNITLNTPPELDIGNDLTTCETNSILLDATGSDLTYLWSNGSNSPTLDVNQSGLYWVTVSNSCGSATDSININFNTPPTVDIGDDRTTCEANSVLLDATGSDLIYLWSNGSNSPTLDVNQSGLYWVTVTNSCGSATDSVNLDLNTLPKVDIGDDIAICTSNLILLDATGSELTYLWNDGSTNPALEVNESGIYWVEVANECGISIDSIEVNLNIGPTISLGEDRTICDTSSIVLDVTGPDLTYLWNDESTSPTIDISTNGKYWVTVTNECGASTDSISLVFNASPETDLGEDRTICDTSSIILDVTGSELTYLWNDGSTNPTLDVNDSGSYWVTVSNDCGASTDSISLAFSTPPEINLGDDQAACDINSILLDAMGQDLTYLWHDGSTNPTFDVNESGAYWVTVTNNCGLSTDSINIDLGISPSLNLGDDRTICDSSSIVLDATVSEGIYRWQDGSDKPTLQVRQSGTYWVEIENACGVDMDTIELVLPELTDLVIPNVFTPNDDGVNEFFVVDPRLLGSTLNIFQRSGIKVFETENYQNDWDGNDLPSGLYFWSITTGCGENHKGSVTILY